MNYQEDTSLEENEELKRIKEEELEENDEEEGLAIDGDDDGREEDLYDNPDLLTEEEIDEARKLPLSETNSIEAESHLSDPTERENN